MLSLELLYIQYLCPIFTGIFRISLKLVGLFKHGSMFVLHITFIRFITQGTVVINIGQDRLPGPKVLDPNYYRQPTL